MIVINLRTKLNVELVKNVGKQVNGQTVMMIETVYINAMRLNVMVLNPILALDMMYLKILSLKYVLHVMRASMRTLILMQIQQT